jgi:hypothetical protein
MVETKVIAPGGVEERGGGMMRVGRSEGRDRTWIVDVDVPSMRVGEWEERCKAVIVSL